MNSGNTFLTGSTTTSLRDSAIEVAVQSPREQTDSSRSKVQTNFMRMMEAHDQVRLRLLGLPKAKSYAASGK